MQLLQKLLFISCYQKTNENKRTNKKQKELESFFLETWRHKTYASGDYLATIFDFSDREGSWDVVSHWTNAALAFGENQSSLQQES